MTAEPTYYFLKRRLPASLDLLGRITDSFQDPTGGLYTPERPSKLMNNVLETTETTFELSLKSTRDDTLSARLRKLLQAQKSNVGTQSLYLDSPKVVKRSLTQYKRVFDSLKSNAEVKEQLKEILPIGGKVYMIVGTMAFTNANIQHSGKQGNSAHLRGAVPTGAEALGSPGLPSSLSMEAGKRVENDWSLNTRGQGDEVFAIEYRIITRKWAGFGKEAVFTNKTPDYQGLTYADTVDGEQGAENDLNNNSDDKLLDENVVISDDGISLDTAERYGGREPVLDQELRLLYYPLPH